ncbi:MAG: hypothetical protein QOD68_685 [Actinomycetota bacterium]|nr:hypothetical protein [Actinomycetota bacterium]
MTHRPDRGSAGLLAVWVAAVVVASAVVAVVWGGVLVARHRAGRTADLAALAAAGGLARGTEPCPAAARVAAAAGADLTSCAVLPDGSVLVVVEVPALPRLATTWGLDVPPARARARAGPPP